MGDAGISGKEDKEKEQYTQQDGIPEHLLDRDQRSLPLQLAEIGCKGHLLRERVHGIECTAQGIIVRLHRHLEYPRHQRRGDRAAYSLAHESHGTKGLEEMLEGDNLRQIGSEYGINHHVSRIFQEKGQIEPLDIHVGRNQKIHKHLIGDHQHKADEGGRLITHLPTGQKKPREEGSRSHTQQAGNVQRNGVERVVVEYPPGKGSLQYRRGGRQAVEGKEEKHHRAEIPILEGVVLDIGMAYVPHALQTQEEEEPGTHQRQPYVGRIEPVVIVAVSWGSISLRIIHQE